MRVLVALGAALLIAATQFVSAAAPAASRTLLAIQATNDTRTLLHVDARTLAPVDARSIALDLPNGPLLRSPDGTALAISIGAGLVFYDTVRMGKIATLNVNSFARLTPVAWPTPQRLFVLGSKGAYEEVLVVDAATYTVAAQVPVPDGNSTVVPLADGIAYLAWPSTAIAPARVVFVKSDGTSRAVTLKRIQAGIRWHMVRGVQVAEIRQPGLTADPVSGTAYLVGAKGMAAEIDSKGTVTYHPIGPVSARRLARVEKSLNGPTRYAHWLGDGRLAVAGANATATVLPNKSIRETWEPAGVAVVDTRNWSSRMIDSSASWFVMGDGALVMSTARVVKAYATDGTLRFSTAVDDNTGYVVSFGGYVYVMGAQRDTVLDLASGAVVAEVPNPHLYLLGADA
jgi:hypothetical protein